MAGAVQLEMEKRSRRLKLSRFRRYIGKRDRPPAALPELRAQRVKLEHFSRLGWRRPPSGKQGARAGDRRVFQRPAADRAV